MHLDLGNLSFFWRTKQTLDDRSEIPAFLPFAFSYNEKLKLIRQTPNEQTNYWLKQVYLQESNIGYLQPDYYQVEKYGGEFVQFVKRSIERQPAPPRSAMDIGCGGCYIIAQLKEMGMAVYCIDPSPVTEKYTSKLGIPLQVGFYPVKHPFNSVDMIVNTGVIE